MSGKCILFVIFLVSATYGMTSMACAQTEARETIFTASDTISGIGTGPELAIMQMGRNITPPDTALKRQEVFIGYGMQKRETLTGSVSTISGDRLRQMPASNVSNMLAGLLPGLIVVTGSGEPGADDSALRIRGNHTLGDNQPLVVIDGIPNRPGGLSRINPYDIKSVSIVKDATAAIYGSQAANGVIFVTTRRGQDGPPQFQMNLNQGFNQPTRIPEMADAPTYLRMLNEIEMYRGLGPRFSDERIQCHAEQADPWRCPDTDWFSDALKPVSFQSRADLSVSGGGETINYFLSLGGLTEDGFYYNSSTRYNQLNFHSNFDIQAAEDIQFEVSFAGRYEDRNLPTQPAAQQFRMLMRGKPNMPAIWPDGRPGPDIENGTNPVVSATREAGYDNEKRYYLQSQLRMNIEIPEIEGLVIRGAIGYDRHYQLHRRLQKPWTLYFWDYVTYDEDGMPVLRPGQVGFSERQQFRESEEGGDFLLNYTVSYSGDHRDHSYSLLAGSEYQHLGESYFNTFRRYFPSQKKSRLNYMGRLNYGYRNKYLIGFTGRAGRSHVSPEEGQTEFFPAVSLGWRAGREEWFRRLTGFFDEFKLRSSWGRTGNDSIESWQSPSQSPVEDLDVTWETATQFNTGLEIRMMDDRLSVDFDYFRYQRSGILWWRGTAVPQNSSLNLPENFGKVVSRGFDGSMAWNERISPDFLVHVVLSGSYATNEIKFLDESQNISEWQRFTGSPMNTGLYYNVIGVFQNQEEIDNYPSWPGARPGDLIFEDVNGDGVINDSDRIRIDRSGLPRWTGGLELSAVFRQVDVMLFFQGAAGGHIYTQTESGAIGNYLRDFADNRWTPGNPVADHPRTWNRTEEYWASQSNTYFLRDTDYIRLKHLEFGFRLSEEVTGRLGIQGMRIWLNGFNLLTFDKLKIMDPEAASGNGQYYPQKRVINLGISVAF